MSSTRSIREGQIEIGIIEHEGHEFACYGATVIRKDVTAYLKYKRGHFWLSTWAGGTMLDCRSEVVERYWSGGLALMFRLRKNRYIVGYVIDGEGSTASSIDLRDDLEFLLVGDLGLLPRFQGVQRGSITIDRYLGLATHIHVDGFLFTLHLIGHGNPTRPWIDGLDGHVNFDNCCLGRLE